MNVTKVGDKSNTLDSSTGNFRTISFKFIYNIINNYTLSFDYIMLFYYFRNTIIVHSMKINLIRFLIYNLYTINHTVPTIIVL